MTIDPASARLERMRAIAKRRAKLLSEAGPPVDHGDPLYDERGLPKQTGAVSKPNLDEVWPVWSVGAWPEGLSLQAGGHVRGQDLETISKTVCAGGTELTQVWIQEEARQHG